MDKNKKAVIVFVCIILLVNLWTTMSMKAQIRDLRSQLSQTQGQLYNIINNTSQEINSLRQDVLDKIGQGNSLLSSYHTDIGYKNGQLECTVNVVPKEINAGELVYLSIGGEKKEATSFNGSDYTATFQFAKAKSIVPVVTFEATTGVRQETLPELTLDEYFSLSFDGNLIIQENNKALLTLSVYSMTEDTLFLLEGPPTAVAIIKDVTSGAELERVAMQPSNAEGEWQKLITYQTDLSKYAEKEGSYSISVDLTTKGGLLYNTVIASIQKNSEQSTNTNASNSGTSGVLMPVW